MRVVRVFKAINASFYNVEKALAQVVKNTWLL